MTVRTEQTEQAEKNQVTVPVKSSTHFKSGKTNALVATDVAADAVELQPAVVVVVVQTLEVELDREPLAANAADVLKTLPSDRAHICYFRFRH